MKYTSFLIVSLFSFLAFSSCIKELDYPVDSCTFSESIDNVSNPYSSLYQEILDEYAALGIPGISIAVNTPEHGWWVGCAGIARIEDNTILKPCHLFHSASMAKTYTATLIMRLYEDGLLDLNDPIRDYLPQEMVSKIANADVVTIRQLLNHTSGMRYFRNDNAYRDTYNDPLADSTTELHFEKYIYGKPALAAPGEKHIYSDTNYALLGMIAEKVSKMTLGDYFRLEISEPLGLVNTIYQGDPNYPENVPNNVNYYFENFPGKLQNCTDILINNAKVATGQSGIFSTPYEYARFFQELMRGNIVETATVELMLSDLAADNDFYSYGYGINVYNEDQVDYGRQYGHGGTGFSRSVMLYFADHDVTIVAALNFAEEKSSDRTRKFIPMVTEIINVTFKGTRE